MKKSSSIYMEPADNGNVDIVPILDNHDNSPGVVIKALLTEEDTSKYVKTILSDGQPIELLNTKEEWKDPKTGKRWVLPRSKKFPEFIQSEFSSSDYMADGNFLEKIKEALKPGASANLDPFPYQNFVRDYLRLGTPYRSLLLEHGLGSGKTRSTIMVSKTFREGGLKTLILTPAFLQQNFRDELKKWEDDDVDINKWYLFVNYNATGFKPKTIKDGVDISGTGGGVFEQLAKIGIGFHQSDPKFGTLFPILYKKYGTLKPPEHMLIVIEEAHNLNRSFSSPSKIRGFLYNLLMQAKDCKIICLSGTPMVSRPYELATLYNVLRGPIGDSTLFDNEPEFDKYYVDYQNKSIANRESLMSRITGLGSYFVGITDDHERVVFPGRKDWTVKITPSPYQTYKHDSILYSELLEKKKSKKKREDNIEKLLKMTASGTYHTGSRAACNFVFPKNIVRPRKKYPDEDSFHQHIYKFQIPQTKTPIKKIDDYSLVYETLQSSITEELNEDEYIAVLMTNSPKEIRTYLSQIFVKYFGNFIINNQGFTKAKAIKANYEPVYNCMAPDDINTILRFVGDYQTRLRLSLQELTKAPKGTPNPLSLAMLKFYSIKMYAIYMTIMSDKEKGAPHVTSDDDEYSDLPYVNSEDNYDELGDDEDEDAEIPADEKETPVILNVSKIDDPDDPLLKDEFANVYLSDNELRKRKLKVVGGPALVYSYFSSAEGANIFSMILKAHDFEEFNNTNIGLSTESIPRKKRFAFFRGGMDAAVKRNILRVFNSRENVNGQLIRVIFVTQAAAEGISLYNIRQIHIMEPHWDNVMIEQVIGRGFRLLAHKWINNPDDRIINVIKYFLVRPPVEKLNNWAVKQKLPHQKYYDLFQPELTEHSNMADHIVQSIADLKDIFRLQLNDIRISVAADCMLNARYNKPKLGCFAYVDKKGPAFSESIRTDVLSVKDVVEELYDEAVSFVTINHKKGPKNYLIYPNREDTIEKIKIGDTVKSFRVTSLYGPVESIPTGEELDNYIVPENMLVAGYYHKKDNKFIDVSSIL